MDIIFSPRTLSQPSRRPSLCQSQQGGPTKEFPLLAMDRPVPGTSPPEKDLWVLRAPLSSHHASLWTGHPQCPGDRGFPRDYNAAP